MPLAHMVRHPIETAEGIGHAVRHPILTGEALAGAVKKTAKEAAGGNAYALGTAVGTIGSLFVLGAGEAEAAENAARLGKLGELGADAGKAGEVGADAGKVGESGADAGKAGAVAEDLRVPSAKELEDIGEVTQVRSASEVNAQMVAEGNLPVWQEGT